MTAKAISSIIHHLTSISAITLAVAWFGWKAGVVVFLTIWASNTVWIQR